MGTRGLTAVFSDGKPVVAQYGQWDHYPEGQGVTVLEFCQQHLTTHVGRERFKEALSKTRFITDDEYADLWKEVGADVRVSSSVSLDASAHFEQKFPTLHRNAGAEVLNLILEKSADADTIPLRNNISFAGESLFCEWAYCIDLDRLQLEVYEGFNKAPVPAGQRFAEFRRPNDEYYPVVERAVYSLAELPTKAKFLQDLTEEEE